MKQKAIFLLLICYLLSSTQLTYTDFFDILAPADQKVLIVGEVQKREHTLEALKQEKNRLQADDGFTKNQQDLNKFNDLILSYKQKLSTARDNEKDYYNTVLNVLSEIVQLLLDTQLSRQKNIQTIDKHITVLENFLKNPNFKSSKSDSGVVYTFDDLQKLYQDLLNTKEKIRQQKDQLAALKKEQEEGKQDLSLISKELKDRERERASFNENTRSNPSNEEGGWGIAEEARLLDLEIKMLMAKKDLVDLTIKEIISQVSMHTSLLEIATAQQASIENDLEKIDRSLRVGELEVLEAQEQLITKKSNIANLQAQYSQEIRVLAHNKQILKEQFEKIQEQIKVDLRNSQEMDEWNIDRSKYESELEIYNLGYLNEKMRVIDSQSDILEAKKFLERARLIFDEVVVKATISWHKISQRNLRSEEDIDHEKAKYVTNKLEGQRIIVSYRDKQELISKNINNLSKSLSNLKTIINDVKKNSHVLIDKYTNDGYRQILSMLDQSTKLLHMRIDLNRKLTDVYTSIIGVERDILRYSEMVEDRLSKIGMILQRSKHAISWENIKNIGSNLSMFAFGLKSILLVYINEFSLKNLIIWFSDLIAFPLAIFYFFMLLLSWFLFFLLLKQLLPLIKNNLLNFRSKNNQVGFIWAFGLLTVELLNNNLLSAMIWITLFLALILGWIASLGLQVLFFLISIPYLCYLTHIMIKNLIAINISKNRFVWVLSFFLYSTIIILLFREAFLLVAYESDLPKVLSALYSVIIRASIIFLIGKDELVSVMPKRGAIWDLARNYVTFYYYPLLIGIISIMVVSDPYILGFNKLVTFIFWGVVLTLILFLVARWVQDQIRKIAVYVFFYATESGARERFDNAKTWYGMLIIALYFAVIAVCVLLLAKIWGYSLYFSDVKKWFSYELFMIREGNDLIPIMPKSFLILFAYFLIGMLLAWAFERFVLQRVFSILLIDRGAQNTVSIISKYFIGLVVVLIGLSSIHLGAFIIYVLGALAFGLVWAIKDPVNDFIAYFIILLDRTVKIGDYIEVDDRIVGVVRKISPRSVLLRRKNSVSIVVPNSKLTSMPVYNWGYTRSFFAFKDIKITVPYSSDPKKVREILARVLSENLNILKSPPPVIRLNDFGSTGYIFMVRGFLSSINVLNQWDIASDIRLEIVEQLRKAGIYIAPPLRLTLNSHELRKMYNLDSQVDQNEIDNLAPEEHSGIKE